MNKAMSAIIKKDLHSITANRRFFLSLLIVPLVLVLIVPSRPGLVIRALPCSI